MKRNHKGQFIAKGLDPAHPTQSLHAQRMAAQRDSNLRTKALLDTIIPSASDIEKALKPYQPKDNSDVIQAIVALGISQTNNTNRIIRHMKIYHPIEAAFWTLFFWLCTGFIAFQIVYWTLHSEEFWEWAVQAVNVIAPL